MFIRYLWRAQAAVLIPNHNQTGAGPGACQAGGTGLLHQGNQLLTSHFMMLGTSSSRWSTCHFTVHDAGRFINVINLSLQISWCWSLLHQGNQLVTSDFYDAGHFIKVPTCRFRFHDAGHFIKVTNLSLRSHDAGHFFIKVTNLSLQISWCWVLLHYGKQVIFSHLVMLCRYCGARRVITLTSLSAVTHLDDS